MASKVRPCGQTNWRTSAVMHSMPLGIQKNVRASWKLIGFTSTTVTRLPRRCSMLASAPPPQPRSRTAAPPSSSAAIRRTYGDVGLAAGEHAALAYAALLVEPRARGRILQDADLAVEAREAGKDVHAIPRGGRTCGQPRAHHIENCRRAHARVEATRPVSQPIRARLRVRPQW